MKTIVVTGGAGFLGSHHCDYLLKNGGKVLCIDNLFTGNKNNIKHLIDNENFHFINHDIIEPIFLDELLIDEVYNLACPASPIHYKFNPVKTICPFLCCRYQSLMIIYFRCILKLLSDLLS